MEGTKLWLRNKGEISNQSPYIVFCCSHAAAVAKALKITGLYQCFLLGRFAQAECTPACNMLLQGKFVQAEALWRRALNIHEQVYGSDHPTTAIYLDNVAQALEIQVKDSTSGYLIAMSPNLGMELRKIPTSNPPIGQYPSFPRAQGKYSEAGRLSTQSLHMRKRLLGDDHPLVSQSLNNCAGFLQIQARDSVLRRRLHALLNRCSTHHVVVCG